MTVGTLVRACAVIRLASTRCCFGRFQTFLNVDLNVDVTILDKATPNNQFAINMMMSDAARPSNAMGLTRATPETIDNLLCMGDRRAKPQTAPTNVQK